MGKEESPVNFRFLRRSGGLVPRAARTLDVLISFESGVLRIDRVRVLGKSPGKRGWDR